MIKGNSLLEAIEPNLRHNHVFWILSAREEFRKWERQCDECCRRKARSTEPFTTGPLPSTCTKESLNAFSQTAMDYGGHVITAQGKW